MSTIEDVWNGYLKKYDLPKTTPFSGECTFGDCPEMCGELLALVLSGAKTATCGALESYQIDMEPIPQEGMRYVLTDWNGKAYGVIEEEKVTVLPFMEVTWEMAKKEGECDTLSEWEEGHRSFFEDDGSLMGYEFTPDMAVVFEEFHLVYKVADV